MTTDIATTDAELDNVTIATTEDQGSKNSAGIGVLCIAAGVAVGTFVVPPVVRFVRARFASSNPDVAEVVAAVEASASKKGQKTV